MTNRVAKSFFAGFFGAILGYVASLVVGVVFGTIFQNMTFQTMATALLSLAFIVVYLSLVINGYVDEVREARYGFLYVLGALAGCWILAQSDWCEREARAYADQLGLVWKPVS